MSEVHAMIHKLVEMFKRVPSIFLFVEGKKMIERKAEGYLCRLLDIHGNKAECFISEGALEMHLGIVMTSVNPSRFFSSCAFSSKISNYCVFRSSYLMTSFDKLGFVVSDYSSLLRCFSQVDTKSSLVIDPTGNHYFGSLAGTNFENGIIFDKKLNYFTYSNSFQYKGYIRNIEDEVTYYGGLRNKLPNGQGLIVVSSKPIFFGHFINGIPSGRGFYFSKREELNFIGTFHSKPIHGVFGKNQQYFEGLFSGIGDEEREVDFESNPVTLNNLKECRKLAFAFEEFFVHGLCRHFNERIFQIRGRIRFGGKQLSGNFDIDYLNGSRYYGQMEEGRRQGLGFLISPEGKFQLFGMFSGNSEVRGYLIIEDESENSIKDRNYNSILIPKIIYGTILYDSAGKIRVRGEAKIILTNGAVYYGQFINNSITGYGKLHRNDSAGSVYTGQLYFGKQYGVGQLVTKDFTYEGEFKNDMFHGYGKLRDRHCIVKGYWQDGLCHYANIEYVGFMKTQCFKSLNILFDRPTNRFEIESLKGSIELYFDKSSGQILADTFEEMNKSDVEEKLGQNKRFERRNSLNQSGVSKNQVVIRKRKTSIQGRENSGKSVFSGAGKSPGLNIQRQESKLKKQGSSSRIYDAVKAENSIISKNRSFKVTTNPGQNSIPRKISKFQANTSLLQEISIVNSFYGDIDDHYARMYSFTGTIFEQGRIQGIIRRYSDMLAVISTGIDFEEGLIYYWNTSRTEEIYGVSRGFKVTGLAVKTTATLQYLGEFNSNKPEGLVVKTTFGKEKYVGMYRRGIKHGEGMKMGKDEDGQVNVFLFTFSGGELRSLAKMPADDSLQDRLGSLKMLV